MRVITLDQEALEHAAASLAGEVKESGRGRFDAIVGIRRGGSIVCDAFCKAFPATLYGSRHDVTLQRAGTKRKGGAAGAILKRLPLPLLNLLRIMESRALSLLNRRRRGNGNPPVALDPELADILRRTAEPRILVIDDAIDSGHTLSAVVASLKNMNPATAVTTAVVTETTDKPAEHADFAIYRNRTLIRFPWSNDFKNTPKAPHS